MHRLRDGALGLLFLSGLVACAGARPAQATLSTGATAPAASLAGPSPDLGNAGPSGGNGMAAVALVAPPELTSSAGTTTTASVSAAPPSMHAAVTSMTTTASSSARTTASLSTARVSEQSARTLATTSAMRSETPPTTAQTMAVTLPVRASLGPLEFISQTLNNCGPASVAEVLAYWGIYRTQAQVQSILRADGNPGGMVPYGVPSYMQALGMDVVIGVGGTDAEIKALVASGFPVIVNQWVSLSDHYGHFRPIEAYDDGRAGFIASDPYLGANHFISYADFDQIWTSNSRRFIVIYPPSRQAAVQATLAASGWDKVATYQADLTKQEERQTSHAPATNAEAAFRTSSYRQGYGALNLAWDELQLGRFDAAKASLQAAASSHANPVVINWIAGLLP